MCFDPHAIHRRAFPLSLSAFCHNALTYLLIPAVSSPDLCSLSGLVSRGVCKQRSSSDRKGCKTTFTSHVPFFKTFFFFLLLPRPCIDFSYCRKKRETEIKKKKKTDRQTESIAGVLRRASVFRMQQTRCEPTELQERDDVSCILCLCLIWVPLQEHNTWTEGMMISIMTDH